MSLVSRLQQITRRSRLVLAGTVVFAVLGVGAVAAGIAFLPPEAPTPPESAADKGASSGEDSLDIEGPVMPYSKPVLLKIPKLGINSNLIHLGKNPDGTIAVPLGDNTNKPAWYKNSPAPGQVGPTIIEGHLVDENNNPSIFFELGNLRPGDKVEVPREDGKTAIFEITSVETFDKNSFPTKRVYGFKDHAAIRLITCGGAFNPQLDRYPKNIIAFGELTGQAPTR